MEHVDDVGSADGLRIVDSGILPSEVIAELFGAFFGDELHVIFAAEFQATGGAGLDASGLETFAYAVGAERAFIDALSFGIETGNIEGASGDTELAADAVFLIEVDYAVGIFDDRAVGGAGGHASGVGTVHALVFAHEPLDGAIRILVLIELDEVPEMVAGLGHGLVGVVEGGRSERHVVPLDAGYFAGFASDTGGRVDELADLEVALHAVSGRGSGMAGDSFGL